MLKRIIPLAILLSLAAINGFAVPVPVSGTAHWNEVSPPPDSNDNFIFGFDLGAGLFAITQIDFTIGDGSAGSLFADPTGAAPGWLTNGFTAPSGTTGTGTLNVTDGAGAASVTFTGAGWLEGETLAFGLDIDHSANNLLCLLDLGISCDDVTGEEFDDRGGISFTLHFATVDPGASINGPNTLTFNHGGWTLGAASADKTWRGELDYISSEIPEPMTLSLMGAGLLAIGVLARRRRAS